MRELQVADPSTDACSAPNSKQSRTRRSHSQVAVFEKTAPSRLRAQIYQICLPELISARILTAVQKRRISRVLGIGGESGKYDSGFTADHLVVADCAALGLRERGSASDTASMPVPRRPPPAGVELTAGGDVRALTTCGQPAAR